MPTYEYACDSCGHRWEEFQSITAKPTRKCPACDKRSARRLISGGGGIIFKGAGFYVTDYRSKGYKEAERKEKGSASADKSGGSKPKKEGRAGRKKTAAAKA